MKCYYCDRDVQLVKGDKVYPRRPDLHGKFFWECEPCKAWVGCFNGTKNPMGRVANAESRKLKSAAHAAFDPLWKSERMTRTEAYAWLRKLTGLSADDCHMGKMPDNILKGVARACTQYCNDKGINTYYA